MDQILRDVIGKRGEKIVELCLTAYKDFTLPLFSPAHLGDKWPAIDFYVELTTNPMARPFFLVQAKSTATEETESSLKISSTAEDIARLLQIPAPTYLLGVHEPTGRVFARSVHTGVRSNAITRIPLAYELTSHNLKVLHDEVLSFWQTGQHKPTRSVFL